MQHSNIMFDDALSPSVARTSANMISTRYLLFARKCRVDISWNTLARTGVIFRASKAPLRLARFSVPRNRQAVRAECHILPRAVFCCNWRDYHQRYRTRFAYSGWHPEAICEKFLSTGTQFRGAARKKSVPERFLWSAWRNRPVARIRAALIATLGWKSTKPIKMRRPAVPPTAPRDRKSR